MTTHTGPQPSPPSASERPNGAVAHNVEAIRAWQAHLRSQLSRSDRLSAWIARTVGRGASLALHGLWFTAWIVLNNGWFGVHPFDPYPYSFLTLTVSLEAIFLALFVLASQNRMADIADKRSHLDLQIDLLAEREMTAMLQMLWAVAKRLEVPTGLSDEQMRDFTSPTDLTKLANQLERMEPE
jgi:uncharacterized membrane protein